MLTRLFLVVACTPCASLSTSPSLPGGAAPYNQETALPDKLPEVKAQLDKLAERIAKRGSQDALAVSVLEELARGYMERGPLDRVAIAKATGGCLGQKRKPLSSGQPDNILFVPAARALGSMGPESTKALIKWMDHKQHRGNLVLRRELISSLGKTKDPAAAKALRALLFCDVDSIIAWSAEALGQFGQAPSKLRKAIFSDVLKVLVTASDGKDDGANLEAGKRWERIKGPMLRTLARLGLEPQADAEAWRRWWNKNKRREW